jgi:hypothetical protein
MDQNFRLAFEKTYATALAAEDAQVLLLGRIEDKDPRQILETRVLDRLRLDTSGALAALEAAAERTTLQCHQGPSFSATVIVAQDCI